MQIAEASIVQTLEQFHTMWQDIYACHIYIGKIPQQGKQEYTPAAADIEQ